jgi:hypothetical protein
VAAFLGHPDHAVRIDSHILHDARTGSRGREGKSAPDIFRPDAYPASLSEAPRSWLQCRKLHLLHSRKEVISAKVVGSFERHRIMFGRVAPISGIVDAWTDRRTTHRSRKL